MNLQSPLNEECDVERLSEYADEYYMGIRDTEWEHTQKREYNARGFSRRSNFTSWAKMEEAVKIARRKGIQCFLTVNTHNIDSGGSQSVRKIIDRFQSIGGTGIICSNPDPMFYGKEKGLKVIASTITGIYNEDAIRMILEICAPDRIILSRDMRYDSILALRELFPDIELEVFGANFGCKFSNAYCYCSHSKETGGMCRFSFLSEWSFKSSLRQLDSAELFSIEKNHWLYTNYLLDGACSVCALYDLTKAGIDSIKIVGRELPGERLLEVNREMAHYLRLAGEAESREEYFSQIQRNPVGTSHLGCFGGYQCYYPEISNQQLW